MTQDVIDSLDYSILRRDMRNINAIAISSLS